MKLSQRLEALAHSMVYPKESFKPGDLVVFKEIFRRDNPHVDLMVVMAENNTPFPDTPIVETRRPMWGEGRYSRRDPRIHVGFYHPTASSYDMMAVDPRHIRIATPDEIVAADHKAYDMANRYQTEVTRDDRYLVGNAAWLLEKEDEKPADPKVSYQERSFRNRGERFLATLSADAGETPMNKHEQPLVETALKDLFSIPYKEFIENAKKLACGVINNGGTTWHEMPDFIDDVSQGDQYTYVLLVGWDTSSTLVLEEGYMSDGKPITSPSLLGLKNVVMVRYSTSTGEYSKVAYRRSKSIEPETAQPVKAPDKLGLNWFRMEAGKLVSKATECSFEPLPAYINDILDGEHRVYARVICYDKSNTPIADAEFTQDRLDRTFTFSENTERAFVVNYCVHGRWLLQVFSRVKQA